MLPFAIDKMNGNKNGSLSVLNFDVQFFEAIADLQSDPSCLFELQRRSLYLHSYKSKLNLRNIFFTSKSPLRYGYVIVNKRTFT